MSETTNNNEPIDRVKDGMIQIPIWRNEKDGKVSYSTSSAERSYFDKKENKYKSTTSLFGTDNLQVSLLYAKAYDRIRELEEADYQASKQAEAA